MSRSNIKTMRIAFNTFGCKINQYESDSIRRELISRGNTIVPFDDDADIYIINTCAVTSKSDFQCRQAIRSVVRRKRGRVVVTGCYAEIRPDEIKAIGGVDMIVGNSDKHNLAAMLIPDAYTEPLSKQPDNFVTGRTRGFLKIQDGCDGVCSYCIVPRARGRSRSVPPDVVVSEFDRLVKNGCPEVVLSGIHIGRYGRDLDDRTDLSGILAVLLERRGQARIRLSSIEPGEVTHEIICMMGRGLCRHLHIPLQSGDDSILAAMRRDYTSKFYLDLLRRISRDVPGIALGADVMVGFPGEGEREFENTLRLVERSPLTHLHVFSFSPRPGTSAASMKNQVPEPIKKKRSRILRELGAEKNLSFRRGLIGSVLEAVVEDKKDASTDWYVGLTDNYVRVIIEGSKEADIGEKIEISIKEADKSRTIAYKL